MAENSDLFGKVNAVVEEIRPSLQAEGGDIELVEVTDEGTVRVSLTGACAWCPMSSMTLAVGIERVLKERVPEIKRVESV